MITVAFTRFQAEVIHDFTHTCMQIHMVSTLYILSPMQMSALLFMIVHWGSPYLQLLLHFLSAFSRMEDKP